MCDEGHYFVKEAKIQLQTLSIKYAISHYNCCILQIANTATSYIVQTTSKLGFPLNVSNVDTVFQSLMVSCFSNKAFVCHIYFFMLLNSPMVLVKCRMFKCD